MNPSVQSASAGSVNYTLNLMNGKVLTGDSPLPLSCPKPMDTVTIPSRDEVLVSCDGGSDNVVVVNTSTSQLAASVPVGSAPLGLVYDSVNGHAYVANSGSDNVSDINLATNTVVASIGVDLTPESLAFDTGNGYLYVTNRFSNNVSVINPSTDAVVKTIEVGAYPMGITYDSGNGYLYVADNWPITAASVSVINGATNTVVATFRVGVYPSAITYDWGNGDVYVVNTGSNNVTVYSTATSAVVKSIVVGTTPEGVAYDSGDGEIYVTNSGSNNVMMIPDTSNSVVASIPVGNSPEGLGYDSVSGYLYVASSVADQATVIDGASATLIGSIPLDLSPQAAVWDSDNGDVYVANSASNNVTVVSGATNTVLTSISVGSGPDGIAYDSGNGEIYVANSGSDSVTVITGATNTVAATTAVGFFPQGVGYDPENGEIYVANDYSNTVSAINGTSNAVAATIPLGLPPSGVVYANGYIFVSDSSVVSVISPATNTLLTNVTVGSMAAGIGYDAGEGTVYVANPGSGNVSVISAVGDNVYTTLTAGGSPTGVGYDGTNGNVFVTEVSSGQVGVISGISWLGNLSVGAGPTQVVFDAGNGYAYVTDSEESAISIIAPSSFVPLLSSVSVIPPVSGLPILGQGVFGALPFCSDLGCPSGTNYSWSLNNTYGTLNTTTGLSTMFTAGSATGSVTLTVLATLSGLHVSGISTIAIESFLTLVKVTPAVTSLPTGNSTSFNVTVACLPIGCPLSSIAYTWWLNNTLGTINNTTGPSIVFTADSRVGHVNLTVNATLNGKQMSSYANITITPGLSLVSMSPAKPTVPFGGTRLLTAVSSCTGGRCPSKVTYVWSLSNGLGSLNSSKGGSVIFTAASQPGSVVVTINATMNGQVVVGNGTVNVVPALSSVSVSPASFLLAPGGWQDFSAAISCTGGPCPAGTSYAWSLSSNLGSLNSTTAPSVAFTASSASGSLTLTVIATLDGRSVLGSSSVTISSSLPALTGVAVSLPIAMVQIGGTLPVSATGMCSPSPCPGSGINFTWALSNSLGSANPLTGPSTIFTAGNAGGSVNLTVTGVLYGVHKDATSMIAISATAVPEVSGVAIFSGATMGNAHEFSASASCSPGPCPWYVTYQWSLNNSLGVLSSTTGQNTTFIAGSAPGMVSVNVTASLNARSVSNSTIVTILPSQPTISKVTITPSTAKVQAGDSITFRVAAVCLPNPTCPSSITFTWSVNSTLGNVSILSGNATVFTAGGTSGLVSVTVTASLGPEQVSASVTVEVTPGPSPGPTFLGMPALLGYAVVLIMIVIVVVAVALASSGRKKGGETTPKETPRPAPSGPPASPVTPFPPPPQQAGASAAPPPIGPGPVAGSTAMPASETPPPAPMGSPPTQEPKT
jgi:YVTN family beta-propeller protein